MEAPIGNEERLLIRQRLIDDLGTQLRQSLPAGAALREELLAVFRTAFGAALARMNLVTREEFDAQTALLVRTREKLETLEASVAELERQNVARAPSDAP